MCQTGIAIARLDPLCKVKKEREYVKILIAEIGISTIMESNNINETIGSNQESVADPQKSQENHLEQASKFINDTSLDEMLEIAEIARRKKLTEPPKWVIPDEI